MEPETSTTTICMKFTKHFLDGQFKQCLLKPNDLAVATKKLKLPPGYSTRQALTGESPASFKNNELCVYFDQVKIGLTWNNFNVVAEIFQITKFTLAMMAPNCIYTIIALYAFCLKHKIDWSPDVFFYLFKFVPISCYVTCKPRNSEFFRTCNLMDSIPLWKQKYFFIISPAGWPFSTKPGYASVEVINQPACPASLDQWLDKNKRDIYILDVLTCDLYCGAVKLDIKTAGSKMTRGKRASGADTIPPKRQKRKSPESTESSDSESDSHSGTGSSNSSGTNKEKVPSDVDVTGDGSPTIAGDKAEVKRPEGPRVFRDDESQTPMDQDTQEQPPTPAYFTNAEGNLEINRHGEIPIANNLLDPFGVVLANFTGASHDTKTFEELEHEDFMKCFQNRILLVSRMAAHLGDSSLCEHKAKLGWKKEYNKMYSLYMDSLKQIDNLEKQAPDLHKSCQDDIATLQSVLNATEDLRSKAVTETEQLKMSLVQKDVEMDQLRIAKDQEIEELKKQLKQQSNFTSLTAEEQFAIVKSSDPCETEMVYQLEQGFEKYRRAALRAITDPSHISIINEIDFYKANEEEEISDSEDEDPAADTQADNPDT